MESGRSGIPVLKERGNDLSGQAFLREPYPENQTGRTRRDRHNLADFGKPFPHFLYRNPTGRPARIFRMVCQGSQRQTHTLQESSGT